MKLLDLESKWRKNWKWNEFNWMSVRETQVSSIDKNVCGLEWKEVKDLGLFDKTTREEKGENHDLQQFTQPCLILGDEYEQK